MAEEETKAGLMDFLINAASFGLMKAKNEAEEEKEKKEKETEEEDKKAKNEEIDKRQEMGDIGGFLKSKGLSDEDIKHVYKIMEKLSYDKSSIGAADNAKNKCKNEDEEDKEEKDKKYKEFKEKVEETAENKKAKNSLDVNREKFFAGKVEKQTLYMSEKEAIELGKQLY